MSLFSIDIGKWCKIRMKIRSNNPLSLSMKLFTQNPIFLTVWPFPFDAIHKNVPFLKLFSIRISHGWIITRVSLCNINPYHVYIWLNCSQSKLWSINTTRTLLNFPCNHNKPICLLCCTSNSFMHYVADNQKDLLD